MILKLVVEFEKCALNEKDNQKETKRDIEEIMNKVQINTNLYEAALNKRIEGKTLFENIFHDVLFIAMNRSYTPNLKIIYQTY